MDIQTLLDLTKPKEKEFTIEGISRPVKLKQATAGKFIEIFKLKDQPSEMQIALVTECLVPTVTIEQVREMRQDAVTAIAEKALEYNGLTADEGEPEKN